MSTLKSFRQTDWGHMRSKLKVCLLACAAALLCGTVLAGQWPQVAAPPRSSVQWVSDNMSQNGIAMQVKSFYSAAPLEAVVDFYRQEWTGNGQAAVENQLGEWLVIGRREGDYYVTVQARAAGKTGTEGFIAVNDLTALLAERAEVDDAFPRMGGTSVVSNTLSYDQGRAAKTLIFENTYSVDANASYYAGELRSAGWSLRNSFERPEAGRSTHTLYFERATESCFITVADAGDGKTIIAVNLTDVSR